MQMNVRYGLIGAGMMGIEHIRNLALLKGADLVAIADPVEASLASARDALGDRSANVAMFADGAALCRSGLVDAVIVATPNFTHRATLESVFDAHLHILCEKPLATTIEDARWIAGRAAGYDKVVWIGAAAEISAREKRVVEMAELGF